MANTLTVTDVYGIVNAMNAEMFGNNATITAINTSTFATVAENMLRTSVTGTYDALNNVIGKNIYAVRRYNGKFKIILKTAAEWGGITRKISYFAKPMEQSTNYNTNLAGTQLDDGSSIDPWVISKKYPLEMCMPGVKSIQYSITRFVSQIKMAFTSERALADFIAGMLTEVANDIESKIEAENRLMVLNAIGATYNVGNSRMKVNLRTEFNSKYGTSYSVSDLLTTYLADFVAFFVWRLKGDMELMSERNDLFHIYPAKTDDAGNSLTLLRHTPADARRLILYMPLIRDEEVNVFPSLFDTSMLRISDFNGVEYWQNPNDPMSVSVTPNQLNTTSGEAETGSAVALSYVVGLLFDRDALATEIKHESVLSTPINPRGEYINTVYHWSQNYLLDQTENMVLYYLA